MLAAQYSHRWHSSEKPDQFVNQAGKKISGQWMSNARNLAAFFDSDPAVILEKTWS